MPMTKSDLVEAVSADVDMPKAQVRAVTDALFGRLADAMVAGDDVRISELGTFSVASRAARDGRNPSTGKPIKIAASRSAKFKSGKALKDRLNG